MSQGSQEGQAGLSPTLWAYVDDACLRFEAAWQADQRPAIESYLGAAPEPGRSLLLRELLGLELAYRRRPGEQPAPAEYGPRFPGHAELISHVFREENPLGLPGHAEPALDAALGPVQTRPDASASPAPGADAADLPVIPGYDIVKELGRGGMGVVYLARQVHLKRLVALKMILAGPHAGPEQLARFRKEGEAVARLQHPGVVQIHEDGVHEGRPFLALEFVDCGSLAEMLDGTPWPARLAAQLVEALARAMQAAHERHIVHRDLKPANVLLTAAGAPKVTDFGLVKFLDAEAAQTQSGAILGTPSYMAPEQARGAAKQVAPAVDVYALGAILYELLTGRPPFRAATLLETLRQVQQDEPVSPSRLQPQLPRDLSTICVKCLEKEPGQRYASAAALAEDVRRFLDGQPVLARPAGRVERALKWARRHPAQAAAYALALLVLGLGGVGGTVTWFWRQAEAAREQADDAREQAEHDREQAVAARQLSIVDRAQLAAALRGQNQARWEAETFQENYRRLMYLRAVDLAYREWMDNSLVRAEQLLAGCPADLRRWEWYYVYHLCHNELFTFKGHTSSVHSVAFSPDGKRLASASAEVKVWDLARGQVVHTLRGHTLALNSLAFSPDGQRLAGASQDKTVRVWALARDQEARTLKGHTGFVTSVAFSPDGQRLASASVDRTVKVWDAASGQEVLTLKGHTGAVRSVAFSLDGQRLASASADQTVKVWDAARGQEPLTLKCRNPVQGVAVSPDGQRLASVLHDGTVKVWDWARGQEAVSLKGPTSDVTSVAFSPDGKRLASTSVDGMVKVWDWARGQEVLSLQGHTDSVNSVAFSPDSQRLASASVDRTVKVWDAASGQEVLTLKGHTGAVRSVAFSLDGQRLASASDDGTVKVWEAASGQAGR
jgi:WD40 repeat protein